MTKKNNTKETETIAPVMVAKVAKRKYYLPTLGVTVEAASHEEALKLAAEQKDEEGDASS